MRSIGLVEIGLVCTQLEWPAITIDIIDNPYISNHSSGKKISTIMKKAQKR